MGTEVSHSVRAGHVGPISRRPALARGAMDVFTSAFIQILLWADEQKQDKAAEAGLL